MVRQIAVPPAARTISTLSRVDYEDAFLVETGPAKGRTGEQWARAMLEGAPLKTRRALRRGWFGLGVKLGSTRDERLVLGWEVRRSSPDFALLGARSRLGFQGELLFLRRERELLFATFIHLDNLVGRAVWAGIERRHRTIVPRLLARAVRSEAPARSV
jgi:hypothetical protein